MDKYTVKLETLKEALKTFTPRTKLDTWKGRYYLAKVNSICDYVIWLDPITSDNNSILKLSWDSEYMDEATNANIEKAAQKLCSLCNAIDLAAQAKS